MARGQRLNRMPKAQSIVEYAILIGVIFAALAAMQVYSRRGINAAIRVAADQVGTQDDAIGDLNLEDSNDNSYTESLSSNSSKIIVNNDGSQAWSTDSISTTWTGGGSSVSIKDKSGIGGEASLGWTGSTVWTTDAIQDDSSNEEINGDLDLDE